MKKIYLQLSGGLGNQLFQYAFAFSLAKRTNRKLFIETKSKLNDQYTRVVSLERKMISKYKINSYIQSLLVFFIYKLELIIKKIFNKKVVYQRPWGTFIDDRYQPHKYHNLNNFNFKKNIFILGYFQSEKYFNKYKYHIKKLFIKKKNQDFDLYKKIILKKNSVAVCIRLYEEIKKNKNLVGGVENINFYNNSINKIYKKVKNPFFVIFCTHESSFIKKINFRTNKNILYLTGNKNITAMDTINLISLCKHHIISNSSLYFWGNYLKKKRDGEEIISKKFINKDLNFNYD